jgi:hypothetical protein
MPKTVCVFCKAPFEDITHRCLSGPLAASVEDDAPGGTEYYRGFQSGWRAGYDAAMATLAAHRPDRKA